MKTITRFIVVCLPIFISCQPEIQSDWLIEGSAFRAELIKEGNNQISLANGLIRRTFRLSPNGATVALDNLMTGESLLRAVVPEALLTVNGNLLEVGGLNGQPNLAYLTTEWIDQMKADPDAMKFIRYETGPIDARMEWNQVRHHAPDAIWPPKGISLRMIYEMEDGAGTGMTGHLRVTVIYEMYDGLPLYCKWLTVENLGEGEVLLDHFVSEVIAAVEPESWVESSSAPMPTPNIYVETDYAFHGMVPANVVPHSVFWEADPEYITQVSYQYKTPCLLKVKPEIGPQQIIQPGAIFESFRAWVLVHDSYDKERQTLGQRKMYRTIAPWITENPVMMHIRYSDPELVKQAIDQCADVGFEMAILTFGSGFNLENEDPAYLEELTSLADYAHNKGIEFGGYSLLSSRSISEEDDVINPATGKRGGVIHGNAPCLGSNWGIDYMRKLYNFYSVTGMDLLEHDGSYPGHICASTTHPGHEGLEDSQWTQWEVITRFYSWCRSQGIYLNIPDWFYLNGSNKNGMGYREVNWSLPREQQVIHTRQNIFDGTWYKTPSMGWMFVPLTEYHGGGAAATIEPLNEHLDHYEMMMAGNLGNGVQACYRGPRLYDTDSTRDMVKHWVSFYKENRNILESDVIHSSSRRADGHNLDWIFHANANLETKGMAIVFNPKDEALSSEIKLNLYYCGLSSKARIRVDEQSWKRYRLNLDGTVLVPVDVPAGGFATIQVQN